MTVKVQIGDILSVTDGIIVHGCNAQGVMGSGIAKQIRAQYPECYEEYKRECSRRANLLGTVIPWTNNELTIVNGITQHHYGREAGTRYVSYRAIQAVFNATAALAAKAGKEVHYPMIGAGLGGGDWSVISAIIDDAFVDYPYVKRTLWLLD